MKLKGKMVIELTDVNTSEGEYSTGLVWTDNLPVAYASNNVNSTANTARGSLNQTESKALDNGYKFVWEFTNFQKNTKKLDKGRVCYEREVNAGGRR